MFYYLHKEEAKNTGRPLLLKKSNERITNMDAEFGREIAVEYIGDKLPFSVVYDESNNSIRAASERERIARARKRLFSGTKMFGDVWTKADFNIDDFLKKTGGKVTGTVDFAGGRPITLPYDRPIGIYNSSGSLVDIIRFNGDQLIITASSRASIGGSLKVSGEMTATGDVVAYSDRRIKENIVPIENATEILNEIEGVYYTRRKDSSGKRRIGFIAQDIEKILPEVVYKDIDTGLKGVAYSNVVALLVNALKESNERIKKLEMEVNISGNK